MPSISAMTTAWTALRLRSLALSFVAAAALGGVAAVATSAVSPEPAHAANPGGYIPQAVVKSRANWWINTYGIIYSQLQSNAKPAPGYDASLAPSEKYRPDCSGFVSMAWHLPKKPDGGDLYTGDFWTLSGSFAGGISFSSRMSHIPIADMKPGDAIVWHVTYSNGKHDGHIRLFDGWANANKTQYYAYEEFSSSAQGRRDIFTTPTSGWKAVRYNRIVSSPSLSVTEYCTYKVTSGNVHKRSGNGTQFTGEGYFKSGTTFLASTQTLSSWRKVSGGWVYSGDGGGFSRVAGGCQVA